MKHALEYIAIKQAAFADLPFFLFLRDEARPPMERLSFAPASAPFAMAFGDLNKSVLYVPNTREPLQQLINVHSQEDSTHYLLFLQDLEPLGFDAPLRFSEALQLLWGDETRQARWTCSMLIGLLHATPPKLRLVIVEAVEAAGAVAFRIFRSVADEFRRQTSRELRFFGAHHEALESGHTMGTDDIEAKLCNIELEEQERRHAMELIDLVFQQFSGMMEEFHAYALRHGPGRVPHSRSMTEC
jgi:hypothetical protein